MNSLKQRYRRRSVHMYTDITHYTRAFVNVDLSLGHITLRDSTQQNCFVQLSRVGRCDHFKDSTQQNWTQSESSEHVCTVGSFVELSRKMDHIALRSPTATKTIGVLVTVVT